MATDINSTTVKEYCLEAGANVVGIAASKDFNNAPEELRRSYENISDVLKSRMEGGYSPKFHSIVYPTIPNTSTRVHDKTHSLNAAPQRDTIERYSTYPFNENINPNKYLDDSDEIYSRLMEFRFNNKLNPKEKYNAKDLRENKDTKDYDLLERYNDDFINYLLNEVAQNNQQEDSSIQSAAYGGTIMKNNKSKNRRKCAFGLDRPFYQPKSAVSGAMSVEETLAGNRLMWDKGEEI